MPWRQKRSGHRIPGGDGPLLERRFPAAGLGAVPGLKNAAGATDLLQADGLVGLAVRSRPPQFEPLDFPSDRFRELATEAHFAGHLV